MFLSATGLILFQRALKNAQDDYTYLLLILLFEFVFPCAVPRCTPPRVDVTMVTRNRDPNKQLAPESRKSP